MARPLKNNADYFSHDSGMRNNAKIKAVRQKHGLAGFAVWCMLLETLTNADNFTLEVDEITVEVMAGDFGIEPEILEEMLSSFRRLKLIEYNSEFMKCPGLIDRMRPLEVSRERKRQWVEQIKGSNTPQKPVLDVQNNKQKELQTSKTHIVKESKDKVKIKESKDYDDVRPTPPPTPFNESETIKNLSSKPGVLDLLSSPEEGSMDFQKIEKFRAAFEREMNATGKRHESEADVVKHFIFWVRKKSKGGGGAANGAPAPSAGVIRRGGVNDIRLTEDDYNRPQYF